jgi:Lrp/AsnC family leucine-responsive transcriptional regulator
MKFAGPPGPELDATDRSILELLQQDCKQPLAALGAQVGLSAPAVAERIHKLEEAGVVTGYVALLDARKLGMDVTAFIGVSTIQPRPVGALEREVTAIEDVMECHHVTGAYTLMVKVKTRNTETLEMLIDRLRSLQGVTRTETMVVLSTHAERPRVALAGSLEFDDRPPRRAGGHRHRRAAK